MRVFEILYFARIYGDNYVGISLCWRLKIGDISFSCWKQNLDVDGIFVMFVSDSIEKEDGGHKNGQTSTISKTCRQHILRIERFGPGPGKDQDF